MTKSSIQSLDLFSPVVEAVILTLASGILTQSFAAYKARDLLAFDLLQIWHFVLYTAITTPPNFLFQLYLETTFPARISIEVKEDANATKKTSNETQEQSDRLNVRNTLIKFFLDQSLAATSNTAMYICLMGGIKGHSYAYIMNDVRKNFLPLLLASYRFWPFICLLNFGLVPMRYRPYVGSAAGLVWGFWLGLREKGST